MWNVWLKQIHFLLMMGKRQKLYLTEFPWTNSHCCFINISSTFLTVDENATTHLHATFSSCTVPLKAPVERFCEGHQSWVSSVRQVLQDHLLLIIQLRNKRISDVSIGSFRQLFHLRAVCRAVWCKPAFFCLCLTCGQLYEPQFPH